jgi:ActR/RegA family two-component response regulator
VDQTMTENHVIVTLDDDPMVSRILEKATGIKSLSFSSLQELVQVAGQYEPLAAFIDIHLGIDECGLDIIPTLRAKWPTAHS